MKKRDIKYWIVVLSAMMLGLQTHAQVHLFMEAQELYQKKNPEGARPKIDSVVLHPDTRDAAAVWTLRGYIYYDLYKKYDNKLLHSTYRDSSIASLKVSLRKDAAAEQKNNNLALLKSYSDAYYNLCVRLLNDSADYHKSLYAYEQYKALYLLVEPGYSFAAKDVEYYLAAGSTFADLYNVSISDGSSGSDLYLENAKSALLKVLELDPKNVSANINIGVIYYNQGVNLIKQMEYDVNLNNLEVIQDNSIKLFKQSLPFMTTAYQLDPKNLKALESLTGIYLKLNDQQKSDDFQQKLEEIKKEK